MHEINKRKLQRRNEKKMLYSTECVQNVKGMENLNFVCFFSRHSHSRIEENTKTEKKLDLQQNSLISGCTCSTISSFLYFYSRGKEISHQ